MKMIRPTLLCTLFISALLTSGCLSRPALTDTNGKEIDKISSETVIALWPEGTAGINPKIEEQTRRGQGLYYNIHNPSLTIFRPQKPNGAALIIMPGGGYNVVAYSVEGLPTAKEFIKKGITIFILKYRLPTTKNANFKHPVPLMDAQRAIKLVRYHAESLQIDPQRIGIMGFSAGGHLASTAGTWFNKPIKTKGPIAETNCRPDFMMLIYSVTTILTKGAPHPFNERLIGKNAQPSLRKKLSNELNITASTPPTFLAHAKNDRGLPYQHSVMFHEILKKNGVKTSLKLYETGGHFAGFFDKKAGHDALNWMDDSIRWLREMDFIPQK
ncbi:MAG: alpha/beta hydrolase [Lentisphaeraceae bacterium]|nr:alpha/beta hydrolase [Lentisphaeraceae bacterium]